MQKYLHLSVIVIIIVAIIFSALMIFLKYQENGEFNMPFNISKISIISTANAEDIIDDKNTWNKAVGEDNDIYIYIDKNKNYEKEATIKEINIENIKIMETPQKGEIYIYKPSENEETIFQNIDENKIEKLNIKGEQTTDIKKLQISNQGGIVAFRISNKNIGRFISNEKEIKHEELLKKINITEDEIKAKISFDMIITLNEEKSFKTTINLEIPVPETINLGKGSKELTDLKYIFKRIQK